MALAGKIALITGGASGLGRATAIRFAKHGAKVALVDLPSSAGAKVATEIGSGSIFAAADITNEQQVSKAIADAESALGNINIVVNCAGIAPPAKVLGKKGPHSLDLFSKVLMVNTVGSFNVLRLAAERMAQAPPGVDSERGVIINTASVAAFDGQIGQAAYAASKGAIVAMALPIARELAKSGIRVVTIAPGLMDTEMLAGLPDSVKVQLAANVPFPNRLGKPDEYAALAQHIVENRLINGEVIRMDGALRMPP